MDTLGGIIKDLIIKVSIFLCQLILLCTIWTKLVDYAGVLINRFHCRQKNHQAMYNVRVRGNRKVAR